MSGKVTAVCIQKNKKKTISLKTKLDILRRFDKGEKAVKIARVFGLAPTTVRTIRDRDGDKIRAAAKSATSLMAKKMITRTRSALMMKMESLLIRWINNEVANEIPLSKMAIQAEAKNLFDEIKSKSLNDNDKNETFEASHGWFERFKRRANLHSIILDDAKQVFKVETGFWKSPPKRTFISNPEKLLNEELQSQSLKNEDDDNDHSIEKPNLTAKQISKALSLIDKGMEIFLQNDPDSERSFKVCQGIAMNINCYQELYSTLKK